MVSVQEEVPAEESATGLAAVNLFMYLGTAISISVSQTIFQSTLPGLLAQHAPGVDARAVLSAGATNIRGLVSPEQLPELLVAYNGALTRMFVSSVSLYSPFPPLRPSVVFGSIKKAVLILSLSACPLPALHWRPWPASGLDGVG